MPAELTRQFFLRAEGLFYLEAMSFHLFQFSLPPPSSHACETQNYVIFCLENEGSHYNLGWLGTHNALKLATSLLPQFSKY